MDSFNQQGRACGIFVTFIHLIWLVTVSELPPPPPPFMVRMFYSISFSFCFVAAERVKNENLNLVCIPTSFQVSST